MQGFEEYLDITYVLTNLQKENRKTLLTGSFRDLSTETMRFLS